MSGLAKAPTSSLNVLQKPLARGQPHPGRGLSLPEAPLGTLGGPCSLAPAWSLPPSPPWAPMTMTEGPTGPKTGALEPFTASAASLPARRTACGVLALAVARGAQGPQPRSKGELQGAAVGALGSSLPQAGRTGRRAWRTGQGRGGWGLLCSALVQPGQLGCQGQSGLARSSSGLLLPSVPPAACLTPGAPSAALATPGSLLYIFETSFYSL